MWRSFPCPALQNNVHFHSTEETGARYLQLNGHQGEVFMCLWNPQLKQLATGSADGTFSVGVFVVFCWFQRSPGVHTSVNILVSFLCLFCKKINFNSAFCTTFAGMCRLWNLSTMDAEKWASNDTDIPLKTAIMPHTQSEGEKFKDVTSVTWSPDGQFLATGMHFNLVFFFVHFGYCVLR